ncbi:outer membrane protein transport protein [Pseudomonas sp. MAP12]|uniref:Outer membrane protein transport protein n=2 Tax=Geopseudomonas aromaticivorans TaxID=2849492 RepID=A0ABS6MYD7_9GAMM|nr:outer membrane protein transport protein [Pseudomonas aromaticivorans]
MACKIFYRSIVGVLLSVSSFYALATDGLYLEGFGAISRGMGGTAVAHYVGPASMMVNPATMDLSDATGEVLLGFDLITTDISASSVTTGEGVSSSTHSNNRGPYVAPQFAFTRKFSNWTVGAGMFAQAGVGVEYGKSSFLSRGDVGGVGYAAGADTGFENASRLFILDIPLAVSYKVNDRFSIGGSLDAKWTGLNLDYLLGMNQLGSLAQSGRASGSLIGLISALPDPRGVHLSVSKNEEIASGADGWGFSGRLGLLYKVTPTTNLGASYMFKSHMNDLKGRGTVTAVDGLLGNVPIGGEVRFLNFNSPAKLDVGLSHNVTDRFLLALDLSRVFWKDALKDIDVGFSSDAGGVDLKLPQNAKDQTIVAIGASYAATQKLTLRAGYRQATQPFNDEGLLALIPAVLQKHASLGFSYNFSKSSRFDAAYSHAFERSMTNRSPYNTSSPVRSSIAQDNFVLNYIYSF